MIDLSDGAPPSMMETTKSTTTEKPKRNAPRPRNSQPYKKGQRRGRKQRKPRFSVSRSKNDDDDGSGDDDDDDSNFQLSDAATPDEDMEVEGSDTKAKVIAKGGRTSRSRRKASHSQDPSTSHEPSATPHEPSTTRTPTNAGARTRKVPTPADTTPIAKRSKVTKSDSKFEAKSDSKSDSNNLDTLDHKDLFSTIIPARTYEPTE